MVPKAIIQRPQNNYKFYFGCGLFEIRTTRPRSTATTQKYIQYLKGYNSANHCQTGHSQLLQPILYDGILKSLHLLQLWHMYFAKACRKARPHKTATKGNGEKQH